MKIIGHRGAAGLALENTLASLKIAAQYNLAAIEFDVRHTKDGVLVLNHDANLKYMAGDKRKLSSLTLKEIQKIPLKDGMSHIISLTQALDELRGKTLIIECKEDGMAEQMQKFIKKYPDIDISITSRRLDELSRIRRLNPHVTLYAIEHFNPAEVLNHARRYKLNGMALNFWLLNPLTYFLATRGGLKIYVYTVNNRILARWLLLLYPGIGICTNHPERFMRKRPTRKAKRYAR